MQRPDARRRQSQEPTFDLALIPTGALQSPFAGSVCATLSKDPKTTVHEPMGQLDETRTDSIEAAWSYGEPLFPGMLVSERVRLTRPLDSGGMGSVWVAEHLTLRSEVAVKFVLGRSDDLGATRLAREAQCAARLVHPHAVRVFDHGTTRTGTPFIVMELLDGESLGDRIKRAGPLPLAEVRQLVTQIAGVLGEAHGLGIVHRDIKPNNIMLLQATGGLFSKLLDFGIAKPIQEDVGSALTAEGEVVGTPLYMAPEQLVDALPADRSADLWGLAVVAYQALTGTRPFQGRTRAALGVEILLGRFETPSRVVPTLPASLDGWFARNLSVERGERCRTANAFAENFDRAACGMTEVEAAPAPRGRLTVPDKLYGRRTEVATLLRAFDRAAAGRSRLTLIAGYSGIGKTALVAEIEAPLAKRGASFVGGKFDQFDRGTPYASLMQAFRGLIDQVNAGEDREAWRLRITEGVRENLAALTDVIPELKSLVGEQPPLEPASPGEARSRFQATIGRFVAAIATQQRPLALFLDDLQWADLPSLDLIASLATNPESQHVLLIGTFRDNEVDDGHPLRTMIERVRVSGAELDELALGPLGEDAVLDLVSDATNNAAGRMRLAVECHAKTRGNAFFLRRFLESLTESDLIRFDPDSDSWTWDLSEIQAVPMAPSVVEFVADEMRRLPPATREALGVAACIGTRFSLAPLAFALDIDRRKTLEALRQALMTEFVLPQEHGGWLSGPIDPHTERLSFRFAHDRVRQAARSLVDDLQAARIHGRVGRYLHDHLDPTEREQRLFEVVEHLNRGSEPGPDEATSTRLRTLNLSAGRRALASAAFEPALQYFLEAHSRLREAAWTDDYEETLAIHVEGARAAYLSNNYETMGKLLDVALERAESLVDRASVQEVRIQALVSQERFAEALGMALAVLNELGVYIPQTPTDADVQAAVGGSLRAIEERGADTLLAHPQCADPQVIAAMRIQQEVMSTAYLVQPQLVPLLVSSMVTTTVGHGLCRESPYGFGVLALVLNAGNMMERSAGVGALAMGLLDRLDDRAVRPSTLHVIACYVTAWSHHIRESVEAELHVFQLGIDVGDLEYAAWGLHTWILNAFVAGVELQTVLETGTTNLAILRYHQQLPALTCSIPPVGAAAMLAGVETDDPYDEAAHIAAVEKAEFRGGYCVAAALGAYVRLILGDLDRALEWANKGLAHVDGAVATYNVVVLRQVLALAPLGRVASDASNRDEVIAGIEPHLEQIKIWSAACQQNHAHRVHLIQAEVARVQGRDEEARAEYSRAAEHAKRERFMAEEALAHELAGRHHLACGDEINGRRSLGEARSAYERWGAHAKCAQLDRA